MSYYYHIDNKGDAEMNTYKLVAVLTHGFEMSEFGYERMLGRGEAKNVKLESSENGVFKGTYEKDFQHTGPAGSEQDLKQKMAEGFNKASTIRGYEFVSCELA